MIVKYIRVYQLYSKNKHPTLLWERVWAGNPGRPFIFPRQPPVKGHPHSQNSHGAIAPWSARLSSSLTGPSHKPGGTLALNHNLCLRTKESQQKRRTVCLVSFPLLPCPRLKESQQPRRTSCVVCHPPPPTSLLPADPRSAGFLVSLRRQSEDWPPLSLTLSGHPRRGGSPES